MIVRIPCPAKVNLFLAVGPPDQTGYHPVRTIYQAIGLYDDLIVSDSDHDEIDCSWGGLPEENTLTKTLRLLREMLPIPPLRIRLRKEIPAQSGMGGGSSDAAGLIRAIYFMHNRQIDEFAYDTAGAVGADVPFFLLGGTALGQGYGQILTALPDPHRVYLCVVRPSTGISTEEAFKKLDSMPRDFAEFPAELPEKPHNDFELVAPHRVLGVKSEIIRRNGKKVMMTGSGSAVYGQFPTLHAAEYAKKMIRSELGHLTWACPALTRQESLKLELMR